MAEKTILLVDDEPGFLEALEDALLQQRYRVRKALTVESALKILQAERIDLATVDIMLPAGASLEAKVPSQRAGLFLLQEINRLYPRVPAFCMSVVSDKETIHLIRDMGFGFLRKGETPLRTVLETIEAALRTTVGEHPLPGKPKKLKGW